MQNKEFVYRGLEFEKLPAFTQRIADEFPGAQILPSNTQPDKALRTREGQYVQVWYTVFTVRDLSRFDP